MNRMVKYAECVTIRDQQLEDKKKYQEENHKRNLKKDLEMEEIRLQKLKQYKNQDIQKHNEKKENLIEVIQQINEKQQIKKQQYLKQADEFTDIMIHIKELQLATQQELMDDKRKKFEKNQEIYEQNQRNKQIKEEIIKKEQYEQLQREIYINERNMKIKQQEEEKERLKKQKESETLKLGNQQKEVQEKHFQLEVLIEKRAQAAQERKIREKEKLEAEIREKKIKELWEVRNYQVAQKAMIQRDLAQLERDEYAVVLQKQKDEWMNECSIQEAQKEVKYQNLNYLQQQISQKDHLNMVKLRDKNEESKKIKSNLLSQKEHLEKIKAEKLQYLQDQNIKKKYMAELTKKKIFGVS